jgi:hypothetical protein
VGAVLQAGANAAHTNPNGKTALMLARANKHEAAAAELMEATKRAGALDLQGGQYKRSALHMQLADIGIWERHQGSCGRELLLDQTAMRRSSSTDARRIVQELRPAGYETSTPCPVVGESPALDLCACAALVGFVDNLRQQSLSGHARIDKSHGPCDEHVDISLLELAGLVGAHNQQRLSRLFDAAVETITLRRVQASGHDFVINFHTDTSSHKTMQVALNAPEDYDGGRLVFATDEGFLQPTRAPGSYTLHHWYMPHGVTALTRGVRYSLFLRAHAPGTVSAGPAAA